MNSKIYLDSKYILLSKNYLYDFVNGKACKLTEEISFVLQFAIECYSEYEIWEHYKSSVKNNVERYLKIIERLKAMGILHSLRKNIYPTTLQVGVTSECNLHCKYCYANIQKKILSNEDMTKESLLKLIYEIKNVKKIYITGGEPFLSKNIIPILIMIRSLKIPTVIFTNGIFLTEKIIKIINKSLILPVISFDSYISSRHDKLAMIDGSYDQTLTAIKLLISSGISFVVQMTVVKENLDDVEATAEFLAKIGVKSIRFGIFSNFPGLDKSLAISIQDSVDFMLRIETLQDYYANKIFINRSLLKNKYSKRYAFCDFENTLFIDPSNKIFICSGIHNSEYELGSLSGDKNIFERRSNILKKIETHSECSKCRLYNLCGGSCKAIIYAKYGSIYNCDVARKTLLIAYLQKKGIQYEEA